MIDNTNKFRNFKQAIPKTEGSLPIVPFTNVKHVVTEWFKYRFSQLKLSRPLIILGDYPSQLTLSDLPNPEGNGKMDTNNMRGISVVLLDGGVKRKGIGEVLRSEELPKDPNEPVVLTYGWHERVQLEVSYWSASSRDRDYGGDLTRTLMFEAHRTGWLLQNGIVEMHLHNYYDTSDDRQKTLNKVISYSVTTFELTREFFGTIDYKDLVSGPRIEDIEFDMELEIPVDGGGVPNLHGSGSKGNTFMPASGNGTLANFDRYSTSDIIVLPSGHSMPLDKYREPRGTGQTLNICTGTKVP